ncbi:hypothetical protein [Halostagnicola sp. A-GB9-2]|uniref:hypothetical protein n=1 Tax=Halostagnicola sp. A-GB9-2 TaxID=3048066 RepID=UPI0024C006F7|nr:hypothetical protein [Halostagnicola sp. A-GB9-2]MDJ1433561.1 hypothetical protein [Halostagnicola sp. A-GB9-2]
MSTTTTPQKTVTDESESESETETTQVDPSAVAGEHTATADELPHFDVYQIAREFATDALENSVPEAI